MAEAIDEYPGQIRRRYPWDLWLDGRVWELHQGEDFDVPAHQIPVNAYAAAKRRGCKVRGTFDTAAGTAWIQAYDLPDEKDTL